MSKTYFLMNDIIKNVHLNGDDLTNPFFDLKHPKENDEYLHSVEDSRWHRPVKRSAFSVLKSIPVRKFRPFFTTTENTEDFVLHPYPYYQHTVSNMEKFLKSMNQRVKTYSALSDKLESIATVWSTRKVSTSSLADTVKPTAKVSTKQAKQETTKQKTTECVESTQTKTSRKAIITTEVVEDYDDDYPEGKCSTSRKSSAHHELCETSKEPYYPDEDLKDDYALKEIECTRGGSTRKGTRTTSKVSVNVVENMRNLCSLSGTEESGTESMASTTERKVNTASTTTFKACLTHRGSFCCPHCGRKIHLDMKAMPLPRRLLTTTRKSKAEAPSVTCRTVDSRDKSFLFFPTFRKLFKKPVRYTKYDQRKHLRNAISMFD